MNIQIVIALDEKYWHKAKEFALFDSIEKNTQDDQNIFVKCLCFGFDVPKSDKHFGNKRWDWARCEINELKSYREGWPNGQKNRKFFICAEGGEFLDYFHFEDSDIIVHIDADTTMQRPFSKQEIAKMQSLKTGDVGGSYHAIPEISMAKELNSLILNEPKKNIAKHFPDNWRKPIFCSGLIVATARTYQTLIYTQYLPRVDKMVMLFNHHAAGQWLMNYIVYKWGNFVDLGREFGHADWFIGSDATDIKDEKLCYKGKVILFNHHKFNKHWNF